RWRRSSAFRPCGTMMGTTLSHGGRVAPPAPPGPSLALEVTTNDDCTDARSPVDDRRLRADARRANADRRRGRARAARGVRGGAAGGRRHGAAVAGGGRPARLGL